MKEQDYIELTNSQIIQKRFTELKEQFKSSFPDSSLEDFRTIAFEAEPVYNCPKGWDKIQKAWWGKKPDLRLTEILSDFLLANIKKL